MLGVAGGEERTIFHTALSAHAMVPVRMQTCSYQRPHPSDGWLCVVGDYSLYFLPTALRSSPVWILTCMHA